MHYRTSQLAFVVAVAVTLASHAAFATTATFFTNEADWLAAVTGVEAFPFTAANVAAAAG